MGTRDKQNLGFGARITSLSEAKGNSPAVISAKNSLYNDIKYTDTSTFRLSIDVDLLTGKLVGVI